MNIDNMNRLISHLTSIPDSDFDMSQVIFPERPCCIAGHVERISDFTLGSFLDIGDTPEAYHIIMPPQYNTHPHLYPRQRAIDMLIHFRDTGEVKW